MENNQVELVATGSVQPHPKNKMYKKRDDPAFIEAIKTLGILVPIVVSFLTRFILSGHRRWDAAIANGMTEIPVHFVNVTPQEEALYLVTYNMSREKLISEKLAEVKLIQEVLEENPENRSEVLKRFNLDTAKGKNTRQILAPITGYSETYLSRIEKINNVNPELIALIDKGDLTINKAYVMVTKGKEKTPSVKKKKVTYCATCPYNKLQA
jgi:ParB-like chromosome segregation protein Spo0J